MKFDFFTLGGRFFWEDTCNFQEWRIQRCTINDKKYRLLDSHNIRRDSGTFEQCKETLLKYMEAYELDEPYDNTVVLIHGFARTRASVKVLADSLKSIKANIIAFNYSSTSDGLNAHAHLLSRFLQNINTKGNLYFINIGAACLLTRKLLNNSNNYRNYRIARVLDINPLNSGSDLAELMIKSKILRYFFGPMLMDITTRKAVSYAKLPQEIDHAIIFCPSTIQKLVKKALKRFESFPFITPPSERSYAQKIKDIDHTTLFPLENRELIDNVNRFIVRGDFSEDLSATEIEDI